MTQRTPVFPTAGAAFWIALIGWLSSLVVMTIVALIFFPLVLIYQGWSFHVFRHTATAAMRRAAQPEEVIGAVLGHAPATVTGGYGGAFPPERLANAISCIDFGFDPTGGTGTRRSSCWPCWAWPAWR